MTRATLAAGYDISRVLKGGWQLAGGHGAIDPGAALADMDRFVEAGITTFDCADIYTGVEELIGRVAADAIGFRRQRSRSTPSTSPIWIACRRTRGPTSLAASIDRCSDSASTHWISCSCTGGTTTPPAMSMRRSGSTSCARQARSATSG